MMALLTLAAFLALWCALAPRHGAVELAAVLERADEQPRELGPAPLASKSWVERPLHRAAVCMCATAIAVAAVFGLGWLPWGVAVGALISWWIGRLESPSVARENRAVQQTLPLAIDLLGACADAGQPLDRGLAAVADAVGGPLGRRFDEVAARIGLGADPATEWRRLRDDPQLASLARTVARSLESGAPLAAGLGRLADDRRRLVRTELQVRARAVGVRAAAPLAACFLPAFMLIGVVPTVAGSFARLMG